MKVTQGYVAVCEDGEFLQMGVRNNWGNESVWVSKTPDIEAATVFPQPSVNSIAQRRSVTYPSKIAFAPVEIRREVILKGYGVPCPTP